MSDHIYLFIFLMHPVDIRYDSWTSSETRRITENLVPEKVQETVPGRAIPTFTRNSEGNFPPPPPPPPPPPSQPQSNVPFPPFPTSPPLPTFSSTSLASASTSAFPQLTAKIEAHNSSLKNDASQQLHMQPDDMINDDNYQNHLNPSASYTQMKNADFEEKLGSSNSVEKVEGETYRKSAPGFLDAIKGMSISNLR